MTAAGRGSDALAARVAADLRDGWYVNLGLGMPTKVARHVAPDIEVMFHSENGLMGIGDVAEPGSEDPDLCDAGKNYTTLHTGAAAFDSSLSFALVRGGHLDAAILGGLQVNSAGDLANWYVPGGQPGVGGAMDLVVGSPRVWVVMTHTDRSGRPKVVDECSYPLTGRAVVDRVYTNLCVFDVRDGRLVLIDLSPGIGVDDVRAATTATFDTAI
ncbi:3-oxoacid CoA-transferase subunit B [Solwaraspora sp. WMMD1047]|uniref:3-oxoacid CoA-transferase subunit B n=1 Tax=Solwaraspora sp. WMMD1047 TaxID=3016102 RepID=UPI0024160B68|nr:3-oxoacid CoA-transferase subunit B [Solwaraspora sp. WMMD1047]MDG4830392.1 3-oxoacid CoA-transferase subunit B [Solwaraspora sp. WMMD1047]